MIPVAATFGMVSHTMTRCFDLSVAVAQLLLRMTGERELTLNFLFWKTLQSLDQEVVVRREPRLSPKVGSHSRGRVSTSDGTQATTTSRGAGRKREWR